MRMIKKRLMTLGIVFLAVVFMAWQAAPALANGAELIFADSPEFLWAELDLLQNGRAMPTDVYPMTLEEYYMTVLRKEMPKNSGFASEFLLTVNPYWVGFDSPYGHFADEIVYLYDSIPPMLELGDKLSVGDLLYARVQVDASPSIFSMVNEGYMAPWVFTTLNNMEFPRIGYATLSIPNASLSMGRFKSGIGNGYFGNTFLNGKAPHYDQVQFNIYGRRIRFFYMLATSSPFLTESEADVQHSTYNWDTTDNDDYAHFDEAVKTFAYHRFEYHPADWVTVGLHEMNIIGGKAPDFNHINPFGFWHNTYTAGCSNVMFGADVSLVPFKGLHLFGEYTVDDLRAAWAEPENSKPGAAAWQVGMRYVLPWSGEVKHVAGAEFTHADPWMYNRWQPYLAMYQRIVRLGGGHYSDVPLGFLYGGDLNHYGAYYSVVRKDGMKIEAGYDHLDKGPIDLAKQDSGGIPIYYDNPAYEGITSGPFGHGPVEQKDTLSLSITYPLPWNLEALGSVSYGWINNFGHVEGVKETLSVVQLGIRWRF